MQRITVDSSHIVAVGYDPAEKVLEIEFKEGQVYQYLDVPGDVAEGFLHADSYGQYFYAYINKHYRYHKVEGDNQPQTLAFVTGNTRKFVHLEAACQKVGVEVEQLDLPIDEIQSDNPEKIALAKAKEAYRLARRPVVANDIYWNIVALRGFPGAYAKEVANNWFKPEDFLALMADKKDRSVSQTDTLVYYDGHKHKTFSYTYWGSITDEPRGKGPSLMQVVVPQGQNKTIAEIEEAGGSAMDDLDTVWADFAKWYKLQKRIGRA